MVKICAKGEPELVRAKAFERIERQRERAERCEKLLTSMSAVGSCSA